MSNGISGTAVNCYASSISKASINYFKASESVYNCN